MKRLLAFVLTGIVLTVASAGGYWSKALATPERLYTASCKTFADVDFARLGDTRSEFFAAGQRARDMRVHAGLDLTPPVTFGRDTVLVTYSPAIRNHVAVAAFRLNDGRWLVRKGWSYTLSGKAMDPVESLLAQADAVRLDALLAQPCLFNEPAYLPPEIPMKIGRDSSCLDGGELTVQVEAGGRRHDAVQYCGGYGFTGQIGNLLVQARSAP